MPGDEYEVEDEDECQDEDEDEDENEGDVRWRLPSSRSIQKSLR